APPPLARPATRNTRGGAARAGLHNFAPSQKRTGLVNRRFGRLDFLKRTALGLFSAIAFGDWDHPVPNDFSRRPSGMEGRQSSLILRYIRKGPQSVDML